MKEKKTIDILIPTLNEEGNVKGIVQAIKRQCENLADYNYRITFIDNYSTDNTRSLIREMCNNDSHIRAIYNARNFGPNSFYYGMIQMTGDCVILICADFQDPVELIPKLVSEWEKGYKIVAAIKTTSKENKFVRFLRTCYYKMIKKLSPIEQIEHFTGFGLYDKDFIEQLRRLDDPIPFLRGIVAELGYKRIDIPYEQNRRASGRSKTNFMYLYDLAMLSFTSYTTIGLRLATFAGFFVGLVSLMIALVYFVYKLLHWNTFMLGMAPVVVGIFFIGAVQLFFMGLIGEYIININRRIMNRPLVIEEERINF